MRHVPLFFLGATVLGLTSASLAEVEYRIRWLETDNSWHYRAFGMPDFDQVRAAAPGIGIEGLPGDGHFHCIPTSCVNLMGWLANIHAPEVRPGAHPWHEFTGPSADPTYVERYNDITEAIKIMAYDMYTDEHQGTKWRHVPGGMHRYLRDFGGSTLGYEVFDDGVERRWGQHAPDSSTVTLYEISRMLKGGAVGVLHWGWNVLQIEDGEYTFFTKTGGHTTTIAGFNRVGDDLEFIVRNPGRTGDYETEQSRFSLERYRIEQILVTYESPFGQEFTFLRHALLGAGRTVNGSLDKLAVIARFTLLRPTWAVAAYVNRATVHSTAEGQMQSSLTFEPSPGQIFVDAELTPDQLALVVASRANDGPFGTLNAIDLATGTVDAFAEIDALEEFVMTRLGTVVTLEAGGYVRHLTPDDEAAESFISSATYEYDATQVDVDDETDRLWIFDPQGKLVSFGLPDLDAREDTLLGDVAPWELVTDFRIDPTDEALWWFAVDGALLQVIPDPSGKGPLQYVSYATPMPAESLVVNGFGDVIVTMSDGDTRTAATFTPDPETGTLAPIASPFDGLDDIGFAFKPTRSRSTLPLDLDEDTPYQLDVTEIQDWFADEEPAEAGMTCGPVDDFEDLAEDDVPIEVRTLDGVDIAITTATGAPMYARTYGAPGARAFYGAESAEDRPFAPFDVSDERFLTASNTTTEVFHDHKPITFTFGRPVSGFGLSTIDLMEEGIDDDELLSLRAFDTDGNEIASHTRQGPQGASGVVLRWMVETHGAAIAYVTLGGSIDSNGGYGLDDFELCRPPCLEDIDGDGRVGIGDLLAVLGSWGPCEACAPDLDGDGAVAVSDLLAVLAAWGDC